MRQCSLGIDRPLGSGETITQHSCLSRAVVRRTNDLIALASESAMLHVAMQGRKAQCR